MPYDDEKSMKEVVHLFKLKRCLSRGKQFVYDGGIFFLQPAGPEWRKKRSRNHQNHLSGWRTRLTDVCSQSNHCVESSSRPVNTPPHLTPFTSCVAESLWLFLKRERWEGGCQDKNFVTNFASVLGCCRLPLRNVGLFNLFGDISVCSEESVIVFYLIFHVL